MLQYPNYCLPGARAGFSPAERVGGTLLIKKICTRDFRLYRARRISCEHLTGNWGDRGPPDRAGSPGTCVPEATVTRIGGIRPGAAVAPRLPSKGCGRVVEMPRLLTQRCGNRLAILIEKPVRGSSLSCLGGGGWYCSLGCQPRLLAARRSFPAGATKECLPAGTPLTRSKHYTVYYLGAVGVVPSAPWRP